VQSTWPAVTRTSSWDATLYVFSSSAERLFAQLSQPLTSLAKQFGLVQTGGWQGAYRHGVSNEMKIGTCIALIARDRLLEFGVNRRDMSRDSHTLLFRVHGTSYF
jgi:hypothetical protein